MEFSGLTLVLTTDCNFQCRYCYQKKSESTLGTDAAKKAIDFFFPYLAQKSILNFYGGEPLLAFDQMRDLVTHIEAKNMAGEKEIQYAVTTNGSLIDREVLRFFDAKKFSVLLSFDGTAQNLGRGPQSFDPVLGGLRQCRDFSGIDLATNSVFTPETVGHLSDSVCLLLDEGIPAIELSFSSLSPWFEPALSRLRQELISTGKILRDFYRRTGTVPVSNFMRPRKTGLFRCSAGEDRITISPEELLWGCCFFYDLARRRSSPCETSEYCFGSLRSFMPNPEEAYSMGLEAYRNLRMDYFFTKKRFCQMCEYLDGCVVCPAEAAFTSSIVGMVPEGLCRLREVLQQERRRFWEEENGSSLQL